MDKDPLLKTWDVQARIPQNFQSEVWRRIEHRAKAPSWFEDIFESIVRLVVVPRFAAVAAGLALVVGVSAGQINGSRDAFLVRSSLETSYVDSINPLSPSHLDLNP